MPDDFTTLSYADLVEMVRNRTEQRDKLMWIMCDVVNGCVSIANLRSALILSGLAVPQAAKESQEYAQ